MSFEVDRDSAWAHIALCADLTWATEPPDEFIIANQRLWAQHCRVSQVLQDIAPQSNNQCEVTDKRPNLVQSQENASRRSVKDVIPESRLAQFYGNFYYDETREKCYTNVVDKTSGRGYNGPGCENPDLTECWMLPEVEYWFRKLVEEPAERSMSQPRRRHYRMLAEDDSCVFVLNSGRWGGAREESALAARVMSVRPLWQRPAAPAPRAPSPPPPTRKMRARRRQPRHLPALGLAPAYWLDAPLQLHCDPTSKFHFEPPRAPQLADCQRAMGRLSPSVQAAIRTTAARCLPYRGTNVSRYAPTSKRPRGPERGAIWWPRDHPSPRLDQRFHLPRIRPRTPPVSPKVESEVNRTIPDGEEKEANEKELTIVPDEQPTTESPESTKQTPKEKQIVDDQVPSTSAVPIEAGLRKKRLYSTVLSMSAPTPINLSQVGCVRLTQKLVAPGLLKLNPKLVLPTTRMKQPNVDNKFEELEKEALEQYKTSDESIDTKFHELEKQAVEQYSNSNSNTSCSSGNSAEKKGASPPAAESDSNKKRPAKFHKDSVDSVVIYSQNFPDLNAKTPPTNANLKNSYTPPRGEKKEQPHRQNKSLRNLKNESQRAASDTDYEARDPKFKGSHKGPMRWTLHVVPPKKRHLTFCVSDFSSDEDDDPSGSIKDAGPCTKDRMAGKVKLSAHGGGDLHHIIRKT